MFKEIKGHSVQIKALRENVRTDKLASAYLFSGPGGIGKKLIAINFAKFINCLARSGDDSCGECPSCKKIEKLQHPDMFLISSELDAKRELVSKEELSQSVKIEQIKEIEKRSGYKPYEARYKIFIIDGAQNLTQEASDALLKTLEEPPKDTIFILVTCREKMLAPTILSRCRRVKFNAFSQRELKEILIGNYGMDEKKAHFIACFAQGGLSAALKIKDRDILKEKNLLIDDFIHCRINFKDRLDAQYGLNLCLVWLRDILILKLASKGHELINIDRAQQLSKDKDKYSFSELRKSIGFIYEALAYLERNINLRLLNNLVRLNLCK